jgi:hypothetical protein
VRCRGDYFFGFFFVTFWAADFAWDFTVPFRSWTGE